MKKSISINKKQKSIALILAIVVLASVTVVPTLGFIFDITSSLVNTFISGLDPEGDLIIRKNVIHPFGDDYVIPDGIQFLFQVSLGEGYANKTVKTTEGDIVADEKGDIIVSVRAGRSVGICEILAGINVTVTELQQLPGFQVENGVVSQTVTIPARDNAVVTFVNSYTPAPADSSVLDITGIKNLEGRDWQEGDSFTFQLDYRSASSEDNQWISLGSDTVTYNPDTQDYNVFNLSEVFRNLTFDAVGTYYFRVSEVDGAIGGITYDDLIRYFDVTVTDKNMDGFLEISQVNGYSGATVTKNETDGSFHVAVDFFNRYAPAGSAEAIITVFKKIEDVSNFGISSAGFSFGIFDSEGNQIAVSEATPAAGETSVKLVFDASHVGQTYTYILKEIGAGEVINGIVYDSSEIQVTISVIDNLDGSIRVESDVTEATFTNIYDPADAMVQLSGNKYLDGRDLNNGEFRFNFFAAQVDLTIPEGAMPVMSATNGADGKFIFEEIVFDAVGVYYYVVSEDQTAPLEGVTYDNTAYGIVVTVTDDGVGQLMADVKYQVIGGEQTDGLTFHNKYVKPEKPTEPTKPTTPDTPPTGDESIPAFYILLVASITLTVVVMVYRRKKHS